ncbi:MAG TPA: hypothetical protein VL688_00515 [Verrucomicrobiae bacterium]|nr:hypothetical protein [Verrucomicrobiae bacterium]
MKRLWIFALVLGVGCAFLPSKAHAQDSVGLIGRGVSKIVGAAFQVPGQVLAQSFQGFPFGIMTGAMSGAFQAVNGVVGGTVDVARGAAPYAKYMVFFI